MSLLKPPRGTHDLLPSTSWRHRHIIQTAYQVAQCFGCGEIATPIFESSEVFERTAGEGSDIVNKEVYSFQDRSGDSLTLRPEGTAGIARAFISHSLHRDLPLKYFYQGPMFRYERPQKGRMRQFHQIGVEFLGIESTWADLEVISMAYLFFQELGLGPIDLEINTIGDSQSRQAYREELVGFLEKHKSGLSEDSLRRLKTNPLRILDSKDKGDQKIVSSAPLLEEFLSHPSKAIYSEVCKGLDQMGIAYRKNPYLVRGMDYYTHFVFEFKSSNLGAQSTVLAGGRYNGLIQMMGGLDTVGIGWAAGVERLDLLLQKVPDSPRPVSVLPLGPEAESKAIELIHRLRSQGFFIDLAYSGNLQKRMKKANRAKARAIIIIGSDELEAGQVQFKNLDTGEQSLVPLENLKKAIEDLHVT